MVNNYTKNALVPRAEGKKYNRDHLAYLTFVCILKQVKMCIRDSSSTAPAIPSKNSVLIASAPFSGLQGHGHQNNSGKNQTLSLIHI